MSGSFKKIDYSIRPAKYAERRMLRDVFRRLAPFALPEEYVYVGFGSVWFSDFNLFHRALGVQDMISIESAISARQRVLDNAPFRIKLDFDRCTKALKRLDWNRHQFLWLDYDGPITKEILGDVRYVAQKAKSGTLLAVSVASGAAKEVGPADRDAAQAGLAPIERFRNAFRPDQLPSDLFEEDLTGRPFADLSRRMMQGEIGLGLDVRNVPGLDPIRFMPICSFDYADNAEMTTLVGLLHGDTDAPLATACKFEALPFIETLGEVVDVDVPLLTVREVHKLEAQLPMPGVGPINLGSIPAREATRFVKLHRYLPHYAVLET